jgi:hypothetical protein
MPVKPSDLALVALLNSKRDFEIARVLGIASPSRLS